MHGVSGAALKHASEVTDQLADQMVSEGGNDWFPAICKVLHAKDAGLALSIATGFEERTCYRYAAGNRKPPGYFIRALLRTDGGYQWLAALMEGSDAQWWRDLQGARDLNAQYEIKKR